jgi:serine-type D-Ala-D-Ala carboxypeptidase/endopeptidase (penicillin-binding protein 4)
MEHLLRNARVAVLAAALLHGTASAQGVPRPPLQSAAEAAIGRAPGWGLLAWSVDRDEPLFAIAPNQVMVPASTNKVLTSIWALDVLGPDHRFATELLVAGPVEDGVLRGHVVLRGSGDPAFGYPEFDRDPLEPLRVMARQLRERGVRMVAGDVIGDATAFDTVLVGLEWPADTGGGASAYAPRVSGLAFQRNMLWVRLEPQPGGGGPPVAFKEPEVDEIPVVSTASWGGRRGWAVRRAQDDTIRVRGSVSGRGPHRYGVGVRDPALLAAGALRRALLDEGITVQGRARVGAAPEGSRVVHRRHSIPLAAMVPKLNRESDNFFAEHLWKAAAHGAIGIGSYERGGPAAALHFVRHADVPYGHVYQMDGSGLSRSNQVSATALVRSLTYAHRQPWSEVFHESLAVAADRSGSMRRMYTGTAAAGNLHAKTGYIRGVRTLAGYVRTRDGELVAFAFLYNGNNTSGARGVQERLGVLLAEYSRHGAPSGEGVSAGR